jgi:hypothetical protein
MEGLTGPLADAFRRGRPVFNAKFAAASRSESPIDAQDFQRHMSVTLDPIVRAVAAEFAGKTDAVVEILFDLSLDLFAHSLLGSKARYSAIPDAWQSLLPRLPRLLAKEPARVAGSITNALYNLSRTQGAKPQVWLATCVSDFSQVCPTVNEFLECAAILAWRSGMPQYRESALQKASSLPAPLAAKALDLPASGAAKIATIIERLQANPWLTPRDCLRSTAPELKIVAKAGAFRGFNGQFLSPPKVEPLADGLLATDGVATWRLHADIYNAILQRTEPPAPHPPPLPALGKVLTAEGSDAQIAPDGTVSWQGRKKRFPELGAATSIAALPHTLAVTVTASHHLFLVALS